jgi:hypothetical protein
MTQRDKLIYSKTFTPHFYWTGYECDTINSRHKISYNNSTSTNKHVNNIIN